jgi:hypothetical protein
MKSIKLKLTGQDRQYLLAILTTVDFSLLQEHYTAVTALLIYVPLMKIVNKLINPIVGTITITMDISMSAAIYAIYNSTDIDPWIPIMRHMIEVELHISNTYIPEQS